jgi:MinD-like ATPase involved in chromosome partitioning or flagellar assembly
MAMRIAIGSVKGSPGATTFGLALAVVWPQPAVFVEADPAGGDLGGRFGVPDAPGLASLAVAARREAASDLWLAHAHRLRVGADVVIAPASGRQASAAVAGLAEHPPLPGEVDVIVDVGRLSESSPAWALAAAADALLVVSGTDVASLDHAAAWTGQYTDRAGMSVVLVGGGRFTIPELVDVDVAVSVPTDRRTSAVLSGIGRVARGWTRFGVPAAARMVALALRSDTTPTTTMLTDPVVGDRGVVAAVADGGTR